MFDSQFRRSPGQRVADKFLLPLLAPFFLAIRGISHLLLGKRSAMDPIGSDKRIEKSIRRILGFLFDQFQAKVSSNVKYRAFGNSSVFINAGNVSLRIVRENRDHKLLVSVAPLSVKGNWTSVDIALAASSEDENPLGLKFDGWWEKDPSEALTELSKLLQPRFEGLNAAFSESRYPATSRRLANCLDR
jgi:hypothetical protein